MSDKKTTVVSNETEFDNEKKVAIFQNDQRINDGDAPLRGKFMLNGKLYNIKLWKKTSKKDGQKYLQGYITEKQDADNDLSFIFGE